jgi:hypothetical protein
MKLKTLVAESLILLPGWGSTPARAAHPIQTSLARAGVAFAPQIPGVQTAAPAPQAPTSDKAIAAPNSGKQEVLIFTTTREDGKVQGDVFLVRESRLFMGTVGPGGLTFEVRGTNNQSLLSVEQRTDGTGTLKFNDPNKPGFPIIKPYQKLVQIPQADDGGVILPGSRDAIVAGVNPLMSPKDEAVVLPLMEAKLGNGGAEMVASLAEKKITGVLERGRGGLGAIGGFIRPKTQVTRQGVVVQPHTAWSDSGK